MTFGDRLKRLIDEKEIKQVDLAKHFGLGKSTISHYISGEREPDMGMIRKLADYFGVSVDYLLGHSDIRSAPLAQDLAAKWPNLSPDRRQRAYQMELAAKGIPDTYIHIPKDMTDASFDGVMRAFGSLFQVIAAAKKPGQE